MLAVPRSISGTLQTHLNLDTNTLATCWKITRSDGVHFAYTSHVADLVIGGETYLSKTGAVPSSLKSSTGTGVDNLEVLAIFDDAAITESDLLAGLYDGATVLVFLVNYADTSMGTITLLKGNLGQVVVGNGTFTAELRSNIQKAQQKIVQLTSSLCRARFLGDSLCKYAGTLVVGGLVVTSVTSNRVFSVAGATQADGYFANGKVHFTSGANLGAEMDVKQFTHTGGLFELQLAMPYTVAVGDTFDGYRGCNHTFGQCVGTFSNGKNFQGEPYVPGADQMMVQPK